MATYTINVALNSVEDKVLLTRSTDAEIKPEELLLKLVNDSVVKGQLAQWIKELAITMTDKYSPTELIMKLEALEK
jgi:hypothetical protein